MAKEITKEVEGGGRAALLRLKPPRMALALMAISVGLHFLLRSTLPWHFGCLLCGLILIALGSLVMMWAWRLFRKKETAICPTSAATALVDRGPFRVTRNPMYFGMAAMLAGCTWILGSVPALFAPVAFFLLMNAVFIPFEERRMCEIFGAEYVAYCGRVRRWI
jgi:protein-S-isoprenylcysteine O-methyltransferase Ste14